MSEIIMSTVQHLEVVQTEDGEVLLRRSEAAEGDAEPLVSLRFSPEVQAMLGPRLNEVALAMLGAGMRATSALAREQALPVEDDAPRRLH